MIYSDEEFFNFLIFLQLLSFRGLQFSLNYMLDLYIMCIRVGIYTQTIIFIAHYSRHKKGN